MNQHALATSPRRGPRLCPIAVAILSLYGAHGGAMALGQQAADSAQVGEVVVVTGQRSSLKKALSAQEKADNIISVISADDIGQMPDKNAAEALARMPGVAVQRDQGEGRYIVVRGLGPDYNAVSINGAQVPSPEASRRAVALDVLPAGLIRSLEVSKTLTPDLDANSLGGSVNVKTLSAFDLPGTALSLQMGVSRDENTGQTSPNAGLLWADRFAGNKLGVAIGISGEKRKFGSDALETAGSWSGGKVAALEYRNYLPVRERQAAALNLDYRPEPGQSYFLRSFISQFSDEEQRDRLTLSNISGGSAAPDTPFSARGERRLRARKYTQEVTSVVLGTDHSFGDWKVNANIGAGRGSESTPQGINDARFRGIANFTGLSYSDTVLPRLNAPAAIYDPASYRLNAITLQARESDDKEHHLDWSVTRNVDWGNNVETDFKAGAKWSRRTKRNDTEQWGFSSAAATSPNYWGAGSVSMSDFLQGPLDYAFGQIGAGISPQAVKARLATLNIAGARLVSESALNDYVIHENIDSAFLQGSTKFEAWTVLAGVRNERTRMDATGNQVSGSVVTPVASSKSYSDWLPALQVRYDIDSKTSLRAAWSNSVVRPNFNQFAPGIALSSATEAVIGNPDLKPLTSSNLDIGVERMLGGDGAVSAYLFSKDIKDFVYRTDLAGSGAWVNYTTAASFANGDKAKVHGVELSYQHSLRMLPAPWNDLVIGANLSVVDSTAQIGRFDKASNRMLNRDIRMPGQAKQIYNVSLGYEGAALSAKLSLNHKSNYLLDLGNDILSADGDRYVDDQRQLDLSMGYKFNKRYQMVFEASNLNNEKYYVYQGTKPYNVQYEQYGRTYKLSLKINLY
ncbi:MAG: TonB-dependent receptor [Telluria sp.]